MVWQYQEQEGSNRRMFIVCAVLLVIVAVCAITAGMYAHVHHPKVVVVSTEVKAKPIITDERVAGRYLLNGTVVWARATERNAAGNYAAPFSQLDTFNRNQYDAWSTDFECPITNNIVPYQT